MLSGIATVGLGRRRVPVRGRVSHPCGTGMNLCVASAPGLTGDLSLGLSGCHQFAPYRTLGLSRSAHRKGSDLLSVAKLAKALIKVYFLETRAPLYFEAKASLDNFLSSAVEPKPNRDCREL